MKLWWLYAGLYGCLVIDWAMTYITIQKVRKQYPKLPYMKLELNLIARYIWKKLGFEKGMLVVLGVISFLYVVMYFAAFRHTVNLFWFMVGAYSIVFMAHSSNLYFGRKEAWFHEMYVKTYGGEGGK